MLWNSLIGHTAQLELLQRVCVSGDIAPTYIFFGPEGVGKFAAAKIFAQRLLCAAPRDANPCEQCPACAQVAAQTHPDFLIIAPDPERATAEITIEQIRTLKSTLALQPALGLRRLVIIDGADLLNMHAANAALKILEEPPTHTSFVLLCTALHRVLPTIRSRAQRLAFAPLALTELLTWLAAHINDPIERKLRAGLAMGSPGRALALPIELIAPTIEAFHYCLAQGAGSRVLETAAEWASNLPEYLWRIELLAHMWRDACALQLAPDAAPTLPGSREVRTQLATRAAKRLAREMSLLLRHAEVMRYTTGNKQLACEELLLQLVA